MQNIKIKSRRTLLFELIVVTVMEKIEISKLLFLVGWGFGGVFCVIENSAIPHARQDLCQIQ